MDRPAVAFAVDVESDWGTGETAALDAILPRFLELLDRRSVRATFFVVASLAARFRVIAGRSSAHEVGSHGLTHAVLTRLDPAQVSFEVEESKRRLEAEGFTVAGFRAPFLKCPRGLMALLERAGYRYDCSLGSVMPSLVHLRATRAAPRGLPRLGASTLRDRITPFSLTWLRLYHPAGLRLIRARPTMFACHLHELLEPPGGWHRLPPPLRRLHARNAGEAAWAILDAVLADPRHRFVSCREHLVEQRVLPSAG